jgi:hypothetical protein|tara:strand:+ start:67 stop:171 length:105 start_codon:yes stop_codon:yes gene_type:complete
MPKWYAAITKFKFLQDQALSLFVAQHAELHVRQA